MDRIRVGIIYGGRSSEHPVSVASARALIESMDRSRYDTVPIGIDRDGVWHVGMDPARVLAQGGDMRTLGSGAAGTLASAGAEPPSPPTAMVTTTARTLAERFDCSSSGSMRVDVMFPLIHGTYGEDGTLQGLLEMAGIPYVGSGVLGSAVGMDKWGQKLMARAAGIPVVDFEAFVQAEYLGHESRWHERIIESLGLPVFVKPSNSGSSMGISKVKTAQELGPCIAEALRYDRRIVVEKGISAREVEVALLGNENPRLSCVGEVCPKREWYDYEAKYSDGGMELRVPADLSKEKETELKTLALRAATVFDIAGLSRIDFFMDRSTGHLYLNEVNTIPGFTAMSVYSKLWEASGIPYAQLVDQLISLALTRHQAKQPQFLG